MLLGYLGDEKYGLWSTILSIISWVNYTDIGISHGLRNVLTKAISLKDYEKAKKSISTAYIVLTTISVSLLLLSIIFVFTLNWHDVFNTEIDMRFTLGISMAFICVNFVLALSNTIFYSFIISQSCVAQLHYSGSDIAGILFLRKTVPSNLVLHFNIIRKHNINSLYYKYNSIN